MQYHIHKVIFQFYGLKKLAIFSPKNIVSKLYLKKDLSKNILKNSPTCENLQKQNVVHR